MQERAVIESRQRAELAEHEAKDTQHLLSSSKQELLQCQKHLQECKEGLQMQRNGVDAATHQLQSLQAQAREVRTALLIMPVKLVASIVPVLGAALASIVAMGCSCIKFKGSWCHPDIQFLAG